MNLKDFFESREKPPELFWSLVLEPGWVQAGIWHIKDQAAEVISVSPGSAWEEDEELLGAADAALSSCVQKLPENFPEPTKTVFGVSSSWVKDGEISSDYLAKIKKICSELSLTPTGFVVLPEAIAHLFKSQEGTPINAVILGLGKESLEISVFKLGNLVGTAQVARSISVVEDVTEGLSRFEGAAPLPSRIIVFDGKEGQLDEAKDALSAASWEDQEKIKFLHTPKVEVFDAEKKVLATSLAGAAEIGNVSQIISGEKKPELQESQKELENVSEVKNLTSPEDLGFMVGRDVSTTVKPAVAVPPGPRVERMDLMQKTKGLFHSLYGKFAAKVPSGTVGKKRWLPLSIVLGLFFIGLFAFWWFYPKATVSVYVSPKQFEEEFDMSFGEEELATTAVSGEKTKSATGTRLVGEKAKGTVQIQNGTASPINLVAGTVLLSSGNLKFSLDNSASVSAALSPSSPGTTSTAVTAETIGAEYNLAKDETFKVGNYPKADVDATATSDFSGGSSREISAVSKEDQDKLEEDLKNELSENAKSELSAKATSDQIFISDLVSLDVTDESFNHKVGDEADNLKLNLTIAAKGIITDKARLADFVREKLKDKIPSGFVLRDSQIDYKFSFSEKEDSKFLFKVAVSVNFLPEIKQDEIVRKISGRLPEVVESYLSSIPGFTRAEIRIRPHFPGRFGTLPRVHKNITIEVVAEK